MIQKPISNLKQVIVGEELLSPKVDFVFKNLFGSDENIHLTTGFLEGILKRPESDFKNLRFLDPNLEREYDEDKKGILDILVELNDGTNINIELQVLERSDFTKRALFYNGKLITRQAKKGKSYHSISKTIIVLVLNFDLIHDSIEYINRFTYYDKVNNVELTDLSEIITIELPKLDITKVDSRFDTSKLLPWLEFISSDNREDVMIALEKYPELQEAYEKLEVLSYDEDRVIEYNKRLMWFYDEVSKIENLQEIEDELKEKAFQLHEVNTQLSAVSAKVDELSNQNNELSSKYDEISSQNDELNKQINSLNIETAKKLLKMGLTSEQITKATGLTETEINNLY